MAILYFQVSLHNGPFNSAKEELTISIGINSYVYNTHQKLLTQDNIYTKAAGLHHAANACKVSLTTFPAALLMERVQRERWSWACSAAPDVAVTLQHLLAVLPGVLRHSGLKAMEPAGFASTKDQATACTSKFLPGGTSIFSPLVHL